MTSIAATLRHNPSGYVWTHRYEVPEEYADVQRFSWEENNFSCDCNRYIFLFRDHGYECFDEPWNDECCGGTEFDLLSLEVGL